jgi:DNA-binding LacI/PurR family transcriptional regulator
VVQPRVTLEEVAARAGVSRATASRVLRGEKNVSDAARDAVTAAAAAISYTPNRAARSLVTGRTDSIAFLVDETEERMFSDPVLLGLLRAAHETVAENGLQLVFTVASGAGDRERFVRYAAGGHVDGVLLLSLHGTDELPERLEAAGVPTMMAGRPFSRSCQLYYVDADNEDGGRQATAHLLASGRTAVGTVTGTLDITAGQDRLAGYRRALEEAGASYDPRLVAEGGFTAAEGEAGAVRLLAQRPDVDAVVAGSDLAAFGVVRALLRAGRRVPDDVAVVGFDDIPDAAGHHPALTTVRQPIADLGNAMSRLLLDRIEGRTPPHSTVLPVELVVRESG